MRRGPAVNVPSAAIEAVGLGRDYGATRALDAFDLVVAPGTMVGLLGPNGAGKTTAMLLLATLLKPSRGTARLLGYDVARERAAIRRRLGLVFQEVSLDGLLTVRENLVFAARLTGLNGTTAGKSVAETLERTGLVARAAQPVRELSGGWRRLADIARATVHRPDLLILDEPTAGLDPEHRERMWGLLEAERRERGAAILFSTHYLSEAEPCAHVALLAQGHVVAAGTPAALKAGVGDEVAEIESSDADELVRALHGVVIVRTAIRTERGYRLGISGPRDGLARIAGAAPRVTRFSIRPTTLEDVYFARTQAAESGRPAVTVAVESM